MMFAEEPFPHLPLLCKKKGHPKLRPGYNSSAKTANNNIKRQEHRDKLISEAGNLSRFWQERKQRQSLVSSVNTIAAGIPFLLEIDPDTDVDFLRGLGFEIVCDLEEGFILVASKQIDLSDFCAKVEVFLNSEKKTSNIAKVYALHADNDRLKKILSEELIQAWDSLDDNATYRIEFSISCAGTIVPPALPKRKINETETDYNSRIERKKIGYQQQLDELIAERQEQFSTIVHDYNGVFLSSFIDNGDSFSVVVEISVAGLQDLVFNFAPIFEVALRETIQVDTTNGYSDGTSILANILPPEDASPIVCVIDSGIQENHTFLAPAILQEDSFSELGGNVFDEVQNGGHGTRVAGAILFPNGLPLVDDYRLPCFIQNYKVLNQDNALLSHFSPEEIIQKSVERYSSAKTKIFNHSIGEGKPFYELKHMSPWAAKIDEVSYANDVLFVQAAGNIKHDLIATFEKQKDSQYPNYFGKILSMIANPAHSLQALTVGAISLSDFESIDRIVLGNSGEPSAFTRVGPGIWDSIKPDVVEFGGTYVKNKAGDSVILTTPEESCPELIRTSPPGPAFARDGIGTSFAAPKVSYIAAEIQKIFPDSPSLLYRALIAQSARWQDYCSETSRERATFLLRTEGYGIPSVERATHNSSTRITLVTETAVEIGEKEAHIYSVIIPDELRNIAENYDLRLEITLSYVAKPRRTRRRLCNYLSTWLDWICSKKNETRDDFEERVFAAESHSTEDQFPWIIHERVNSGIIKDFSRSRQTLQKDWCTIKANDLPDEFCIAIRGHAGWGPLYKAKYVLVVSFEALTPDIEIYESIQQCNKLEIEVDHPEILVEV